MLKRLITVLVVPVLIGCLPFELIILSVRYVITGKGFANFPLFVYYLDNKTFKGYLNK